jgi:hypothetical protein
MACAACAACAACTACSARTTRSAKNNPQQRSAPQEGTSALFKEPQHADTHLPACPSATASFSAPARSVSQKLLVFAEPSGFRSAYLRRGSHLKLFLTNWQRLQLHFDPNIPNITVTLRSALPVYNVYNCLRNSTHPWGTLSRMFPTLRQVLNC